MSEPVAIITGASRGIGPHIASALASAGHPVLLTARTGALVEERVRRISEAGGRAAGVAADITLDADRREIIEAARRLGPIGVVVNNAALGPIGHFDTQPLGRIADVIDVNLTAPIELTRLAIPAMLSSGAGRVVNVSSVAAKLPMPYMVMYSVTKAGLTQFSRALDLEYGDRGIHATTVLPGGISEEGMSVRAAQETGVDLPDDGAVRPEVVAAAVVAATRTRKPELYVGRGSRFMTNHPRLAYRLMRSGGVFELLGSAADRYRELDRTAA